MLYEQTGLYFEINFNIKIAYIYIYIFQEYKLPVG